MPIEPPDYPGADDEPYPEPIQTATHEELDRVASAWTNTRLWSPERTEECPVQDWIHGGWIESDEQLRNRIKGP